MLKIIVSNDEVSAYHFQKQEGDEKIVSPQKEKEITHLLFFVFRLLLILSETGNKILFSGNEKLKSSDIFKSYTCSPDYSSEWIFRNMNRQFGFHCNTLVKTS